jgi:MFS family permease
MNATQSATSTESSSELRRHWKLVLAASLGVMVSFASIFIYSFSVLLKPLSAEFGWTRGQVSAGFSIAALTVAFASPFIGRLGDRIGVRPVIIVASTIFGLAFASLAMLRGPLWQFYSILFIIGIIGNGTTQLTWARAVTSQFDVQRGMALALMMMGGGVGSMLVPWITGQLVSTAGWRAAYTVLGGLAVVIGPALAFFALKRQSTGVSKPGHGTAFQTSEKPLRNKVFRVLLAGFFLVSLGANGCVAHLAALLTDRGISISTAATVLSILGAASVSGRFLTGLMIDRHFAPLVGFYFVAASAIGILMLLFTSDAVSATIAAALIGLAMGAEADIFPYLISRYMGLNSFSELYGYAFSAYAVGGATGPLLMGMAHDKTQSYGTPLIAGAAATAIAAGLLLTLPHYDRARSLPGSGRT